MKLRQKLAAVLAAAMVVTSVPVVTMAASANRVTQTLVVEKDKDIESNGVVPKLVIEPKDTLTSGSVFFVEIEGGEFDVADMNGLSSDQFEVQASKDEIMVKAKQDIDAEFAIPMHAKATAEETIIKLVPENTVLTKGEYVIARTSEAKALVEIGDTTSFYDNGTIADITLTEAFAGALEAGDKFEIVLENSEFEFVNGGTVKFGKGLTGEATTTLNEDKDVITVEITEANPTTARGEITLTGVKVATDVKNPETGDLMVSVEGEKVDNKEYKVAEIAEFGTSLTVKDDKVVEIVAGTDKEVEFTFEENVADTIANGRTVDFVLENGWFKELPTVKGGDSVAELREITEKIDGVERIVGFEAELKEITDKNTKDKYEFTAELNVPVSAEGTIAITAEGRAINEEVEADLATVKAPFTIETEAADLKVGLKGQEAGEIVIEETDKGMLNKGNIEIRFEGERGMEFTGAPEVEVEGDLRVGKAELIKEDGEVVGVNVPVTRTSREASTVTIKNFVIDVDRTVPEGKFDATIGGSAISKNGSSIEQEGFVVIGTPNTEDAENGLRKGTAAFTVGKTTYTVNGETKEMDGAAYVTATGRTMLPVRYVSDAFGINGNNILFTKLDGTITILAGNRTIQLKNGSNVAVLNGAQIRMDEKVVIKEGRTYIPVGEIGRLLGVSVSWDNATKTATFTNK